MSSIKSKSDTVDVKVMSHVALDDLYDTDGAVDPIYQAKSRVLSEAIQEIGMGRYQYHLFIVAGMGWFA